ncbi:helix-turn-helix domain-containing protein [Couchioplanes caeruleus]|uniref:helix-turn-helix domain-containing protein n=1 Tax=Couchioplanes caeruleus TaxID=56438 RepID=UPI00201C733D|nr:helix-turn-helix domain-containing protein [Couchioplanes caeruleus]UQU64462.1 helix-turn-helix domain-containing protein [Couchioplanes caeruleus]
MTHVRQPAAAVNPHKVEQWAAVLAASESIVHVDRPGGPADVLDPALERHSLGAFGPPGGEPGPGRRPAGPMDPLDTIGMMVIETENAVAAYGHETFPVTAGDVVFWDGGVPLTLDPGEDVRRRVLLFPRASVVRLCPRYEILLGRPLTGHGALISTLFEVVDLLRPRLGDMAGAVRHAAANLLVQLFSGMDPEPAGPDGRPHGERLLEEIVRYVDDHLGEPDLRPARIAAAHSISIRTLYSLFADLGSPVSTYIRQRRLSRSYRDVTRADGEPIGVIARRWGFANAAQFSRLFRERYGIPPSRLRGDQEPGPHEGRLPSYARPPKSRSSMAVSVSGSAK